MAAIAYQILQTLIVAHQGAESKLKAAVGGDLKGKFSTVCYILAIPLAFAREWIAIAIYVFVALLWIIPDRRIESKMSGA